MQIDAKKHHKPAFSAKVLTVVVIVPILVLTLASAGGHIIGDLYADSTKREVAQLEQKGCKFDSETSSPYKALVYVCPDGAKTKVFSR